MRYSNNKMEIKFNRVHTAVDLTISSIVLAAGIGLYFIHSGLGAVIAVCGLLMLIFYKGGYRREGDRTLLKKEGLDISRKCREQLTGYLAGLGAGLDIDKSNSGGTIRVEIYYEASGATAYVQVFDFADYLYRPATEMVELKGKRAETLLKSFGLRCG